MNKNKAFFSIISNLSVQVVSILFGFIIPKILIERYGSHMNGMLSSINQFLGYLALVEGGISTSAIVALYKPLLEKNEREANAILFAVQRAYTQTGFIFLALVSMLAIGYPFIVSGQVEYTQAFLMVFILGLGTAVEFFFVGKYRTLLIADQKSYVLSNIQTLALIVSSGLKIAFILNGMNLVQVMALTTTLFVGRGVWVYLYCRKHYPKLGARVDEKTNALDKRWDALLHRVSGLITSTFPVVVITIFCGLKEVSVYGVYAMVFAALASMISSLDAGMTSGFGVMLAHGNADQTRTSYQRYEIAYSLLFSWVYACASLLILPFITAYTAKAVDVSYYRPLDAAIFALNGMLGTIRAPQCTLINAAGHFTETRKGALIEVFICVCVSLFLVRPLGITGVLLGTTLSYFYRTIDIIAYTSKNILKNGWHHLVKLYSLSLCSIGGCYFLFSTLAVRSGDMRSFFLSAVLIGALCGVAIVLAYTVFYQQFMKSMTMSFIAIIKKKAIKRHAK